MMRFFSVIFLIITAQLLIGCGVIVDQKDFTIKSTITASYDGKPIAGSAILFQRLQSSSTNYTRGEAAVLDLQNGKRAYLLLSDRDFRHVYSRVIHTAYGPEERNLMKALPPGTVEKVIATPVGTRAVYNYRQWANRAGVRYYAHPLLVAFKNEADPTSIFLVETEKPTTLFGRRFVFNEWSIERVPNNTPLTKKIEDYLPWASRKHPYWIGKSIQLESSSRGAPMSKNLKNRVTRRDFTTIDQGIK